MNIDQLIAFLRTTLNDLVAYKAESDKAHADAAQVHNARAGANAKIAQLSHPAVPPVIHVDGHDHDHDRGGLNIDLHL